MLTLLFHLVLVGIFIVLYKSVRRRIICHAILFVTIAGYASLYVPSILRYLDLRDWMERHPELNIVAPIETEKIVGIFLPHLTCSSLCKKLLLSGRFDFVETEASMVKDLSGSYIRQPSPYARWTLETTPKICWDPDEVEIFAAANVRNYRGLLAQGVCLNRTFVDELNAPLRFSKSTDKTASEWSDGWVDSTAIYEARFWTDSGLSHTVVSGYKSVSLLLFPLSLRLKIYYLPTGISPVRVNASYGIPTLAEFIQRLAEIELSSGSDPAGPLIDETRLVTIEEAARSTEDIVRWSAAFAMCSLKNAHPGRFDGAILGLLDDTNRWVRAAAELARDQREGTSLCGHSARHAQGVFLQGPFFNPEAARKPSPEPLTDAARALFDAASTSTEVSDLLALAEAYDQGNGFAVNPQQAIIWYEKAAGRGNAYAQYQLGLHYYHGHGVDRNHATALNWFEHAAASGHESAQFFLDRMPAIN